MRKAILACVVLLLVGGSVYGGMRIRRATVRLDETAQAGWCCFIEDHECRGAVGSADCREKGGISFTWDAESCTTTCSQ